MIKVIKNICRDYSFFFLLLILCLTNVSVFAGQEDLVNKALIESDSAKLKIILEKITDTDELVKVALEAKSNSAKLLAVKKITDQKALTSVAIGSSHDYFGENAYVEAVKKITDEDLLFKVALEAKDSSVSKLAIIKVKDQKLLAEAAIKRVSNAVYMPAIEKITDKELLAKIALDACHYQARRLAIKKLTDKNLLKDIALKAAWETDGPDPYCWRYGFMKDLIPRVNDKDAILKIALYAKDHLARSSALELIKDQKTLSKIALEDKAVIIRYRAVEKITDQKVLTRVVLEDKETFGFDNDGPAIKALKMLTSKKNKQEIKKLFAEIALKAKCSGARKMAVEKITDQNILTEVAFHDDDNMIRIMSVTKLDDKNKLLDLINQNNNDIHVKNAASVRLMTLDPIIIKYAGKLNVEYKFYTREKKYGSEFNLHILYIENVNITLTHKNGASWVFSWFSGDPGSYSENFTSLSKTNKVTVDLNAVATDIINKLSGKACGELAKNSEIELLRDAALVIETKKKETFELVKGIQKHLKDLGYEPGAIDGVWGNKTKIALKSFIKDYSADIEPVPAENALRSLERIYQNNNQ